MKDYKDIHELIGSQLIGTITEADLKKLKIWIAQSEKHRIEYEDIVALWNKSESLQFPGTINQKNALAVIHANAGITNRKIFKLSLIHQIAAVLVLSVILSATYSIFFISKSADSSTYQEVCAASGTRSSINLPDGSMVYLNSGSTIRFSNQLASQKERRVELNGEGYFKVAKDTKHPFIVQIEKLEVRALGTEFNVNAYEPKTKIEIALVEGKVSIGNLNSKADESLMILDPDQLASYIETENRLYKETEVSMEKYVGWTKGKMVFIDDPFQDVVKRLEIWYNVEIQIADNQLKKYRFTGTFINESLEDILSVFGLTSPLQYEIKPASIASNGKFSKRIVTLKSK